MKTNILIIALAALLSGCVTGDPTCYLPGNEHYAERIAMMELFEREGIEPDALSQSEIGLISAALIDCKRIMAEEPIGERDRK